MHTSGRPGSVRKIRWVSVTIDMTCLRMTSAGARTSIVLPTDLDIFLTPSVPSTVGASVKTACGSGNVSPYRALNARTISRDSSRWAAWSFPTGTSDAL